jgi:hypothetical protein
VTTRYEVRLAGRVVSTRDATSARQAAPTTCARLAAVPTRSSPWRPTLSPGGVRSIGRHQ